MRNGGQLLVQSLIALGARKSFGVPGESYLAVLDALHDSQGRLDFVLCRHEGGASFMAAAWGKLTGQPGICFVTRGPGGANAMIGIHSARQDSAPMILFVGQIGTRQREREAFQEVDYRAVFGTVTKWAVEVDHADRIPELLSRAWAVATSGRPGPVVMALPEDMLTDLTAAEPLTGPANITAAAPDGAAMAATHALLARAERPLILIGGNLWPEAGRAALQGFAETAAIPVITAFRCQDAYDNHSPCYAGEAGVGMPPHVRDLISRADVILALGTRFDEMTTEAWQLLAVPCPRQKLVHVHAAIEELAKIYQPVIGIPCDPASFAQALDGTVGRWTAWRDLARAGYQASFAIGPQPSPVDMGQVMAWLGNDLPEDVIVTHGAGNFTVWPDKFLRYGPRARLLGPQSGAMGYGLPAAIAAKLAYPGRMVVCFAGDGDFQMTGAELATAAQAGAMPITLLLDNGIYGTIRAHQERQYPGRVFGTTIVNPDFVALARAYGCHAERVAVTADFPAAFARAKASATGAVLVLNIAAEAITPRQTLSDLRALGLRDPG